MFIFCGAEQQRGSVVTCINGALLESNMYTWIHVHVQIHQYKDYQLFLGHEQ